jgi:hypothetical protein
MIFLAIHKFRKPKSTKDVIASITGNVTKNITKITSNCVLLNLSTPFGCTEHKVAWTSH